MSHRRSTQLDVAREAGVARSTVSLALRNHPSIPVHTQERVREAAARLGYQPDPMLSALADYRNQLRPATYHGTLAWLANDQPPFHWRTVGMFQEYYNGCQARAATHGYRVEIFDLAADGMSPAQLSRIFQARNIGGILLCPQPRPNMAVEFPFDRFAAVAFGYSLVSPQLDIAAPMQFRAARETMRRLYLLGYRKVGYVHSSVTDARADHNFLAGYLVERHLHGRGVLIPPLDEDKLGAPAFRKWFKKYRPDAVVTGGARLLGIIAQAGYRVPEDIGVACPSLPLSPNPLSGVREDSFHIGESAVDFLVSMLHKGMRGVPAKPRSILVPGVWTPGTTLTQPNASCSAKAPARKSAKRG
jgi:DNA-binding LacI/PurR family transcriptional regulator